jgi:DNA-binding FrmR family transcriptional regulator
MDQKLHLSDHVHGERCDYNNKTLNRIRRIKGQLNALEKLIEADEGSCQDRVIRARTIEKGMTSLINHLVDCYIENTVQHEMQSNPEETVRDLQKILKLMNN